MERSKMLLAVISVFTIALAGVAFGPDTFLISVIHHNKLALRDQLLAIADTIPTQTGKNLFLKQSHNLMVSVDPELVDLDSQLVSCSANIDGLSSSAPTIGGSCVGGGTTLSSTKGMYLGGQCCGAMMDITKYHEELEKLQSYKNIPDIPLNPYKTPISLAQKWIAYDQATTLTPDQQRIYNEALQMSKEGPCCCRCWHYFVNEGVAKKLIANYHFNAQQIDEYWAASDIC